MREKSSVFTEFLIFAIIFGLPLATPPAEAQQTEPELRVEDDEEEAPEPSKKRFDFRFSLDAIYDENLLNLRDDAIAEFESGDYEPDRFLITSVEDGILVPEAELKYSVTPESGRSSRFGVVGRAYRPQDNEISEFDQYAVYYLQDLSDVRADVADVELERDALRPRIFKTRRKFMLANRSRIKLAYVHTDGRYAGQLTDDDFGVRRSARYDLDSYRIGWDQRLNRGDKNRLRLKLAYLFDEKDYNQAFDERDSEADRFRLGLDLFHLQQAYYWHIEGMYEFIDSESNTALIGTVGPGGTIQDDLTNQRSRFRIRLAFNWYSERNGSVLSKTNRLRFGVAYSEKEYTTDNLNDLTHFRRDDEIVQYSVEYVHPVFNSFTVELFGRYNDQQTNRPVADVLEETTFDDYTVGLAFNWYTNWTNK